MAFKAFVSFMMVLIVDNAAAQIKVEKPQPVSTNDALWAYHSYVNPKPVKTYTKIDYTRPDNQLMSWPDYPLTQTQIDYRNRQWDEDHKLGNMVAKDIVKSVLTKKKKVAVIPKF